MVMNYRYSVTTLMKQANTANTEIILVSNEFEILSWSSCKSISETSKRLFAGVGEDIIDFFLSK